MFTKKTAALLLTALMICALAIPSLACFSRTKTEVIDIANEKGYTITKDATYFFETATTYRLKNDFNKDYAWIRVSGSSLTIHVAKYAGQTAAGDDNFTTWENTYSDMDASPAISGSYSTQLSNYDAADAKYNPLKVASKINVWEEFAYIEHDCGLSGCQNPTPEAPTQRNLAIISTVEKDESSAKQTYSGTVHDVGHYLLSDNAAKNYKNAIDSSNQLFDSAKEHGIGSKATRDLYLIHHLSRYGYPTEVVRTLVKVIFTGQNNSAVDALINSYNEYLKAYQFYHDAKGLPAAAF